MCSSTFGTIPRRVSNQLSGRRKESIQLKVRMNSGIVGLLFGITLFGRLRGRVAAATDSGRAPARKTATSPSLDGETPQHGRHRLKRTHKVFEDSADAAPCSREESRRCDRKRSENQRNGRQPLSVAAATRPFR